jgi:hypothetical protein
MGLIDIDIEVRCEVCDARLETTTRYLRTEVVLDVKPCEDCIEEACQEVRDEITSE